MIVVGRNNLGSCLTACTTVGHNTGIGTGSLSSYLTAVPFVRDALKRDSTAYANIPVAICIMVNFLTCSVIVILSNLFSLGITASAGVKNLTLGSTGSILGNGALIEFVRNLFTVTATSGTLEPVSILCILIFVAIAMVEYCSGNSLHIGEGLAAKYVVNAELVSTCLNAAALEGNYLGVNRCSMRLLVVAAALTGTDNNDFSRGIILAPDPLCLVNVAKSGNEEVGIAVVTVLTSVRGISCLVAGRLGYRFNVRMRYGRNVVVNVVVETYRAGIGGIAES